ncbi:MAG: AAA family ATPase [Pseudomonadales bacterium]
MDKVNPFKPGMGRMPPHLAGRDAEQSMFALNLEAMYKEGVGNTVVMYGPRGMGKTVLLNWLKAESDKRGITAKIAAPSTGMKSVDDLAQWILPPDWLPSSTSVGVEGLLHLKWDNPSASKRAGLVEHLIDACQQQPHALLLDEAHRYPPDACADLLNVCQQVSVAAPFFAVLAGTPGLEPFLREVGATFVERVEKIGVGPLDKDAAAGAISVPLQEDGISIQEEALAHVVQDAQRYPFFLQLWGTALWAHAMDRQAKELAQADVDAVTIGIQEKRVDFYESRYEALMDNTELLIAANGVADAFKSVQSLDRSEIGRTIADSLGSILPDQPSRAAKARELSKELNRIDFIWRPPNSTKMVPGIPSFMTYVQTRFTEQSRLNSH